MKYIYTRWVDQNLLNVKYLEQLSILDTSLNI